MGFFNKIDFIRDEISEIPDIKRKPRGGINTFTSKISLALSLIFKEKEIITFALLQWGSIAIGYLLWVQMLDWIPEDVWRSDEVSIADLVLLVWSFMCVGVAAFPIGIFSGCMGAAHFLHRQGQESTIAACLRLVLPQSWSLWIFHWIDGWLTVNQILKRIPRKNGPTLAERALSEALYYAWKLGTAGILPSIITGNGLVRSGKLSVRFVKDNFIEVAKLRAGYSAMCWIIGIGTYIGTITLFNAVDIVPEGDEIYSHVYSLYSWAALPILVAVGFIMLCLRPIYIIALCDLYSDYIDEKDIVTNITDTPSRLISTAVTFGVICLILGIVYVYRVELGIVAMLATT